MLVEGRVTEPRKIFPGDRIVYGNMALECQIPDDGEVVEPAIDDDVPCGSSDLQDRWLLERRCGGVDQ